MSFTYLVVGAGSIGTRHFNNLKGLERHAVLIPWREFDRSRFELSLKENRSNVAVVLATATSIRLDLISICAAHDVPVYIEKPVGYEPETLRKIYSIPKALQQRSVVGFMMRYHPVVGFVVSNIPEKVFRSRLAIGHDVNKWRNNWRFSQSYASDPDGGGVLLDLCHEIDIACLLAPDLEIGSVRCLEHPDFGGVDVASDISAYSEKAGLCSISLDYLSPRLVRDGRLEGLAATLDYSLVDDCVCITGNDGESRQHFEIDRNQLFTGLMADFITLAETGNTPRNPLCPRMDLVERACFTIADAWNKRRFVGQIGAELQ